MTDGRVLLFKAAADAGSEINAHGSDGSALVAQAIAAKTDLIPNIYEGWCAFLSVLRAVYEVFKQMNCIVYRRTPVGKTLMLLGS